MGKFNVFQRKCSISLKLWKQMTVLFFRKLRNKTFLLMQKYFQSVYYWHQKGKKFNNQIFIRTWLALKGTEFSHTKLDSTLDVEFKNGKRIHWDFLEPFQNSKLKFKIFQKNFQSYELYDIKQKFLNMVHTK